MKRLIRQALTFGMLLPLLTSAGEAMPTGEPDRVLKKDGWEFRIYYRAKGTRSEGQHGILILDGRALPGHKGEEKETPFGSMIYYGSSYEHLWDETGWNFKDKKKILPSPRP